MSFRWSLLLLLSPTSEPCEGSNPIVYPASWGTTLDSKCAGGARRAGAETSSAAAGRGSCSVSLAPRTVRLAPSLSSTRDYRPRCSSPRRGRGRGAGGVLQQFQHGAARGAAWARPKACTREILERDDTARCTALHMRRAEHSPAEHSPAEHSPAEHSCSALAQVQVRSWPGARGAGVGSLSRLVRASK